jgi:hypothetical protein
MLFEQPFLNVDRNHVGLALPFARVPQLRRDQAELVRTHGTLSGASTFAPPSDFGTTAIKRKDKHCLPVVMFRPTSRLQMGVVNADLFTLTEPRTTRLLRRRGPLLIAIL